MSIRRRHTRNLVGTCALAALAAFPQVSLWIPLLVVALGNEPITKRTVLPSRPADAWFGWFTRSLSGSAAVVLFIAGPFGWGWRMWLQAGVVACLAMAVIAYALWDFRTLRASDNPANQPITSSAPK